MHFPSICAPAGTAGAAATAVPITYCLHVANLVLATPFVQELAASSSHFSQPVSGHITTPPARKFRLQQSEGIFTARPLDPEADNNLAIACAIAADTECTFGWHAAASRASPKPLPRVPPDGARASGGFFFATCSEGASSSDGSQGYMHSSGSSNSTMHGRSPGSSCSIS